MDDQQLLDEMEHRMAAHDDLRRIIRRTILAAHLCREPGDWLNCLRDIAKNLEIWEQEHGAL